MTDWKSFLMQWCLCDLATNKDIVAMDEVEYSTLCVPEDVYPCSADISLKRGEGHESHRSSETSLQSFVFDSARSSIEVKMNERRPKRSHFHIELIWCKCDKHFGCQILLLTPPPSSQFYENIYEIINMHVLNWTFVFWNSIVYTVTCRTKQVQDEAPLVLGVQLVP